MTQLLADAGGFSFLVIYLRQGYTQPFHSPRATPRAHALDRFEQTNTKTQDSVDDVKSFTGAGGGGGEAVSGSCSVIIIPERGRRVCRHLGAGQDG